MKNHRNVRREFEDMLSAYTIIDRDWNVVDITTFANAKKVKYNRFLSLIVWCARHTKTFKLILARTPWAIWNGMFRHIVEDIENIFNYMRQNSGACYIVRVWDERECILRLIPTNGCNAIEIKDTIITYLGLEEYGIELGHCGHRPRYHGYF